MRPPVSRPHAKHSGSVCVCVRESFHVRARVGGLFTFHWFLTGIPLHSVFPICWGRCVCVCDIFSLSLNYNWWLSSDLPIALVKLHTHFLMDSLTLQMYLNASSFCFPLSLVSWVQTQLLQINTSTVFIFTLKLVICVSSKLSPLIKIF